MRIKQLDAEVKKKKRRKKMVVITWDNPEPADSSEMLSTLKKLGKVKRLYVKTTAALLPKDTISHADIKAVVERKLHPTAGRAAIVNMGRSRIVHIDFSKGINSWKQGYPE